MAICVHHEDIGPDHIGICRKCGRTVQYSDDLKEEPVVLKEGSRPTKRGRLSNEGKKELLEIGPEAYAAKYGYTTGRGLTSLKKAYNKQFPKVIQQVIQPRSYPPLLQAVLDQLPAGGKVSREKKDALVKAFSVALDLLYTE